MSDATKRWAEQARLWRGVELHDCSPPRCGLCDAHTAGDALVAEVERLEVAKDGAYAERNRLVAALSKLFPAVLAETAIEGWDPEWHHCVYIELPTGQVSWHIHASELAQFGHLRRVDVYSWDGHTTDKKYARLDALEVQP